MVSKPAGAIAGVLAGTLPVAPASTEPLAQLALFAVQIGLAALLREQGIVPAWVMGHSVGEIAAAHAAGALGLDDAICVVLGRSVLQRRTAGQGAMGLVEAAPADLRAFMSGRNFGGEVTIAAENGPRATVVAGAPEPLAALFAALAGHGVAAREVAVDIAGHSPQMAPLAPLLAAGLEHIAPLPLQPSTMMMSTVTAAPVDGGALGREYWARNLREPVLFAPALAALCERVPGAWMVEISPHPVLARSMREVLEACGQAAAAARVVPCMAREQPAREGVHAAVSAIRGNGGSRLPERAISDLPGRGMATDELVLLSAPSEAALRDVAAAAASFLAGPTPGPDAGAPAMLADLAYTAATRRSHHDHRLACVARSASELGASLAGFARGQASGCTHGRRRPGSQPGPVLVFSGHGSQWPGMGRELLAGEPSVRTAVAACDRAMAGHLGWSVLDALVSGREHRRIAEVQPLLFAMQMGLFALWRAYGVVPGAVVGHSMGEVAAACAAGAISLDDAARIICARSRVLARIEGKGAMLAAELSPAEAERAAAEQGGEVSLAAVNGPRQIVFAGAPAAVETLAQALAAREVFCRRVAVDAAAHSPQIEPLLDELEAVVGAVSPRDTAIPMYSTVTGGPISGRALDARYWARNLREPVLFAPAVVRLGADGFAAFVEVSPHPIVTSAVRELIVPGRGGRDGGDAGTGGVAVGSLRRGEAERAGMLAAAGALYAHGHDLDWAVVFARGGRVMRLWPYPWQRTRYWLEPERLARRDGHGAAGKSPLLGTHVHSSLDPRVHLWDTELAAVWPALLPDLGAHRIGGQAVVPAAVYLAMILDAARERFAGAGGFAVTDIRFCEPAFVPEPADGGILSLALQIALVADADAGADVRISMREDAPPGSWRVLVSARAQAMDHEQLLPEIAAARREREAGAARRPGARVADFLAGAGGHVCHPVLLDACLQEHLDALLRPGEPGDEVILAGIARLVCAAEPDAGGEPLVRIAGVDVFGGRGGAIEVGGDAGQIRYCERRWEASDAPLATAGPSGRAAADEPGFWLVFADSRGVCDALAAEPGLSSHDWVRVCHGRRTGFAGPDEHVYELAATEPALLSVALGQILGPRGGPARCRGAIYLWSLEHAAVPAPAGCAPGPSSAETACAPGGAGADAVAAAAAELARVIAAIASMRDSYSDVAAGLASSRAAGAAPGSPRERPHVLHTWIITRGAHPVADEPASPIQAALASLGLVLAAEHPGARVAMIDIGAAAGEPEIEPAGYLASAMAPDMPTAMADALPAARAAAAIAAADLHALGRVLRDGDAAEPLCLRGGRRHVARLAVLAHPRGRAPVRADRSYLVTGGVDGAGALAARRLVERGARHVLLISRGSRGSRSVAAGERVIAELTALGARDVRVAWLDITDRAALAHALARMRASMPPLAGIIHAAGVTDDARLAELDQARLAAVLAPKIDGAAALLEHATGSNLDFAVFFSSLGARAGVPGQGAYAAANGFLDGLAAHWRRNGVPALSIGWCGWRGVGLATTPGGRRVLRYLALQGIGSLSADDALDALDALLGGEWPAHVVLVPPAAAARPVDRAPGWAPSLDASPEPGGSAGPHARERVIALEPGPRRLAMLEQLVTGECARVLAIPAVRLERGAPLQTMGMDSLLAVELKNRLEHSLAVILPATLVWQQPTIAAIAARLHDMLETASGRAAGPGINDIDGIDFRDNIESGAEPKTEPGAGPNPETSLESGLLALLTEIEDMPESEVERLLATK